MKRYALILAGFFVMLNARPQESIWKMTYDVSLPLSATGEFAGQFSWRGIALDFDRFINDQLSVGLGVSWSVFLEKEPQSYYQNEDMLTHGTQVRYINSVPLLARFSWYTAPSGSYRAYFSAGVGTAWQERRRDVGLWTFGDDYWQFALSPEAGIIIPVSRTYLTAKLRYVQGFKTPAIPSLSYLSLGVGYAW